MKVEILDVMGSDLTVVNAARVSFAVETDQFRDKDKKLIKYLAAHGHWTPFAHVQVQLRIKAPVMVARQLVKSSVGLVWNEISRRYVDFAPEFTHQRHGVNVRQIRNKVHLMKHLKAETKKGLMRNTGT